MHFFVLRRHWPQEDVETGPEEVKNGPKKKLKVEKEFQTSPRKRFKSGLPEGN